jgi:hypothetical protein
MSEGTAEQAGCGLERSFRGPLPDCPVVPGKFHPFREMAFCIKNSVMFYDVCLRPEYMKIFLLIVIANSILIAPFHAQTPEPRVAAIEPRNGDQDVAPDLKEIVVTFDQDMSTSGFSFVGGGPAFPKAVGKPAWRSARQCVLPVQLEPNHAYTVGINSATHTSFRSSKGLPVAPVVLSFKTRGAGGEPGAPTISAGKQAESVRQLREAIDKRYSYRDVHVVDWAATWKEFEPKLLAAKSAREFAIVAGEMLAATRDIHIWLMEGGEIVPAFRRSVAPNANVNLLPKLVSGWTQKHAMIASGKAAPQIGYVAIHSWERKHAPQLLEAAFAALAEVQELPALIVDVRFNSGGDETLAREFAGCFVRERVRYARNVILDPGSVTGFSAPMERWLEPNAKRPAYTGRVAVLMGPVNMSSAESFLHMMKQAPNCKLIGARSYGASGNPKPTELANGVTVFLPSWKEILADGSTLEMKGIAPDVEVAARAEDLSQRDPVIEKAIEWLRR